MDKFDIHDLLSFDLYFTIVINQLKFETTSWFLKEEILGKFTISIVLLYILHFSICIIIDQLNILKINRIGF